MLYPGLSTEVCRVGFLATFSILAAAIFTCQKTDHGSMGGSTTAVGITEGTEREEVWLWTMWNGSDICTEKRQLGRQALLQAPQRAIGSQMLDDVACGNQDGALAHTRAHSHTCSRSLCAEAGGRVGTLTGRGRAQDSHGGAQGPRSMSTAGEKFKRTSFWCLDGGELACLILRSACRGPSI